MPSYRAHASAEIESLLEDLPSYYEKTHDIAVNVKAFWLDEQSSSEEHRFTWLYHVNITNHSAQTIQILRRTWILIDAYGNNETIEAVGVIGEQPILFPHETFEYSSGTELQTPSGLMKGYYVIQMLDPKTQKPFRQKLHITIPTFSLDIPTHKIILQ